MAERSCFAHGDQDQSTGEEQCKAIHVQRHGPSDAPPTRPQLLTHILGLIYYGNSTPDPVTFP